MKRTRMVKLITDTLNNLEQALMTNKIKADVILDEIERAGMLPASVETNGEYHNGKDAKELIDQALSDYHAKVEWES